MQPRNDQEIWIRCATLYTPFELRRDWCLQLVSGKIRQMVPASEMPSVAADRLLYDPEGIVVPGFIDLHVHGARGADVMEGTAKSLETISEALAAHGTTSFLPTTISAPDSDTEHALRGFSAHSNEIGDGAQPLGVHMEGPYLNPVRRGAHSSKHLRVPDLTTFRRFVDISGNCVTKITVAPEIDDGLALINEAIGRGIYVSIGHSDATCEQALAAVEAGAHHATHCFNAMRPFHQREPGILGVVLTDDRVYAELIADGVHVHWNAVSLLLRVKGVDRTILITDGISAVDREDGFYQLGNINIEVRQGECRNEEGHLAGSILTQDRAVRNLVQETDLPLHEAVTAATVTPARSIGMGHRKGIVAPGYDADLTLLDSSLAVRKTIVGGRVVYSKV